MGADRQRQRLSGRRIQLLTFAALLIVVGITPSGSAQSGLHADGGPDQTIVEGWLVDLDATGSFDPGGVSLSYRWLQVAGPPFPRCGGGTWYDGVTTPYRHINLVAPLVGPAGTHGTFRVTVSNGQSSASDLMDVTVADGPYGGDSAVILDTTCDPLLQGYQTSGNEPYTAGAGLMISDTSGVDRRIFFRTMPEIDAGPFSVDVPFQVDTADLALEGLSPPQSTGVESVLNLGPNIGLSVRVEAIQRTNSRLAAFRTSDGGFSPGIPFDWGGLNRIHIESPGFASGAGRALLSAGNASETIDIVDLPSASTAQPTFEFGARSGPATVRVLFFPVIGHSPFFGAPMAYAGGDQTVPEETPVTLDGSASYDPGGDPLTYQWQQIAGTPVALNLSDPSHPVFTAPSIAGGTQTLTFRLVVSDGQFTSVPDTVDVTVRNVNHAPVADAGLDQTVAEGSPVILNGANSFDRDDEPLAYRWLQTGGPIVALADANTAHPSFTAPLADAAGATLTFDLTVSDGPASTTDSVNVRVENVNHAPVANAGPDQTVNEGGVVMLDGRGSGDPDGDALTYTWHQVGGPAVTLSSASSPTPTFVAPAVGPTGAIVTWQLVVRDGSSASDPDEIAVRLQHVFDPPACDAARPNPAILWPPTGKLVAVALEAVADPRSSDPVALVIDAVTQDERVSGSGDTGPDAAVQGAGVMLRAERAQPGNGRIYHIDFTATNRGGTCRGTVMVGVPRAMSPGTLIVDDGRLVDSTRP